jgi:hypothetical protein
VAGGGCPPHAGARPLPLFPRRELSPDSAGPFDLCHNSGRSRNIDPGRMLLNSTLTPGPFKAEGQVRGGEVTGYCRPHISLTPQQELTQVKRR